MTEKTKADLILERLDQLEKKYETGLSEIRAAKNVVTPEKHEEPQKGHKDIDEQLACPTCKGKMLERLRPEIEKDLRPLILKEVKEKLKSKEIVTCDGCGEIVEKTQEECHTCHGKHAH